MKSFHPLRVVVEERSKLSELFFPDETACGWLLTQLPNVTSRGRAKSWPTLDRRPIKNAKQPPPPSLKNSAEWKLNLIIFALGGSNRRCPTRHKGRRGWRRRPTKKIPLLAGVGINPLDISSKKKTTRTPLGRSGLGGGRKRRTEGEVEPPMKEHCITRFRVINARGGGSFEGERTAFRICRG